MGRRNPVGARAASERVASASNLVPQSELCIDCARRGILNRSPITPEPWRTRFPLSAEGREQMAGRE